ncbi:MAG: beta-ketoacyl-ACP synthase II [bacterium]
MKKRVVITGIGVVSSLGNNRNEFWQNLFSGKSGIGPLTRFDASGYPTRIAGEVKDFDPSKFLTKKDIRHMDEFCQYGIYASCSAVEDAGLDLSKEDVNRIGVVIGSGIGGLRAMEEEHKVLLNSGVRRVSPFLIPMMIVNMVTGQTAIILGVKGPSTTLATACATGTHAIGDAYKIIQRGEADVMIAGGSESPLTPLGVAGFCAARSLSVRNDDPQRASRPFDNERDGFVMSEGAGVIVLETLEHAVSRKAKIYGEMAGYGMSLDAYHITSPDLTGDGAARAMNNALLDANLKPTDVDYINAHGTSTKLNDKCETLAIKKVFGDYAHKLSISSTKSMTGHLLGAAGGIEGVICALILDKKVVLPTINYEFPDPECDLDYVPNKPREKEVNVVLSNSFGFGGQNGVIIMKRFTMQ